MLSAAVTVFDGGRHRIRNLLALEVIVDFGIAETQVGLIGLTRILIEKVGRGSLEVQA